MCTESNPHRSTDALASYHREGAEGASELAHSQNLSASGPAGALGVRLGPDALGVHGNEWVRSFDEAYVHSSLFSFSHQRYG